MDKENSGSSEVRTILKNLREGRNVTDCLTVNFCRNDRSLTHLHYFVLLKLIIIVEIFVHFCSPHGFISGKCFAVLLQFLTVMC